MEQQELIQLAVGLGSGAIGGNIAGLILKKRSLGFLGNSVLGILGGGAAAYALKALNLVPATTPNPDAAVDVTQTLTNVGAGVVGGGVLITLISLFKGKSKT